MSSMYSPELQQLALQPSADKGSPKERKVLVLYTGGTIGMKNSPDGLKPKASVFIPYLRTQPNLHDAGYISPYPLSENTLVLPLTRKNIRVIYTVFEYKQLLDSSNINAKDWAKMVANIKDQYANYDGFVILHGTDTMAYTASALSFSCEDHTKSIVLTGAQVPIFEVETDAQDNLLGALMIAGQFEIPEVTLYFYHKLYRGNRVRKVDASRYAAFDSPNFPPLLSADKTFEVNWDLVLPPTGATNFDIFDNIPCVRLLKFFPGFDIEMVKAVLAKPVKGVVVESFGTGNAPNIADILQEFKKAVDSGVLIVNCTQCLKGMVTVDYSSGKLLENQGLIAGRDLTPEGALGKLYYVLGKTYLDIKDKRELLKMDIKGEFTEPPMNGSNGQHCKQFLQTVCKILCNVHSHNLKDFRDVPLGCEAVKTGDLDLVKAVDNMECNLNAKDHNGQTPLHVAISEGHLHIFEYLLNRQVNVNIKDRSGNTPLKTALMFRRPMMFQKLLEHHALISKHETDYLEKIMSRLDYWNSLLVGFPISSSAFPAPLFTSLVAPGNVEQNAELKLWEQAGVDKNRDPSGGKHPLESAMAAGKTKL